MDTVKSFLYECGASHLMDFHSGLIIQCLYHRGNKLYHPGTSEADLVIMIIVVVAVIIDGVCVRVGTCLSQPTCGDQKTTLGSQIFPSTMNYWAPTPATKPVQLALLPTE